MPSRVQVAPAESPETALLDQILDTMKSASRVQVLGHVRPDGDCLGSLLAVHHILNAFRVDHVLAAADFTVGGYDIIRGYNLVEPEPRAGYNPDLTVYVDCADWRRAFKSYEPKGAVINIDHHHANSRFGSTNWIDGEAAATAEMLYLLAKHGNIPIDPPMADALLLGLMTDTGAFRYSNVRPWHFEMTAELMRAGGDIQLVSRAAYENRDPRSVELTGRILSSLQYDCDGRLVWGEARWPMLKSLGGTAMIPENLASELRSIRGVEVAILLIENEEGGARVNLRSSGEPDVSLLAMELGGGGHRAAAGITLDKIKFEEAKKKVIETAKKVLG